MSNQRLRNWCFTLNNYTNEEYEFICNICCGEETGAEGSPVRYIVVGKEVGDSGTPHLQGYVELRAATRLTGVKKILGADRVHLESRKGTAVQAAQYCKKQDAMFYEAGIAPRGSGSGEQGRRCDLEAVAAIVRNGASAREVFAADPSAFIRYNRGINAAIGLFSARRNSPTQSIWRFGVTGSGKSRDAFLEAESFYPGSVVQLGDVSGKWFDGITPCTRAVVYDEFDGTMPITVLLRILDRYPCQVPVKGGMVQFCPRIVFITSQYSPFHYYGQADQWKPLKRRIVGRNGVVLHYTRLNTSEDWEGDENE